MSLGADHIVSKTPVEMYAGLIGDKQYSDMEIESHLGEKTPVLSYFLKARSRVFKTQIDGIFGDSSQKTIKLDYSQEVIDSFLTHIYTFTCVLPEPLSVHPDKTESCGDEKPESELDVESNPLRLSVILFLEFASNWNQRKKSRTLHFQMMYL
jgi:hypothetical protein